MGGFLGMGNSSAATDRSNQLSGVNANWNVYNRGLPIADTATTSGQNTTAAGIGGLQQAQNIWKGITSGSPTAISKIIAPQVNQANDQAAAQRSQQAAMGTARGGGVNAINQGAETNRLGAANNAALGVESEAPQQLQSASAATAGAGEAQMKDALSALGLDESTANEIINSSIESRPISENANAQVRQQWSNFLEAMGL